MLKASILAGIQIGFLQFTAGNISFPDAFPRHPNTAAAAAINTLSFTAIGFHISGAVLSQISAAELQKHANDGLDLLDKADTLNKRLLRVLVDDHNSKIAGAGTGAGTQLKEEKRRIEQAIAQDMPHAVYSMNAKMEAFERTSKSFIVFGYIASINITIGMVCLLASLAVFVITTQTGLIWKLSISLVGGSAVWPLFQFFYIKMQAHINRL